LRQILLNLIGNALKFTEKGEVAVRIASEERTETGIRLHFSIRDTGVGIPEHRKNVIFDAFTQADNSMTRKYGGTGLGLTITSRLVQLMGGRVWVDSELGQGSTFHFTADFVLGQARATHIPASPEIGFDQISSVGLKPSITMNPPPEAGRKLRILLAEDNLINQILATRLLEKRGHSVTVANDGREALKMLEGGASDRFDVVLMDVQMPEMDGFEVTAAIRQREKLLRRHIPIVAITAHAMKGDEERCHAAGMDAYISKPIQPMELFRIIESCVETLAPNGPLHQLLPQEEAHNI
jgi:CheY-like chemotaxis protein